MNVRHYLIIMFIIVLFNVTIFAVPFIQEPYANVGYFSFSIVCHQKPDRSFFINGEQLPVCHRCLGIYLGALLGVVGYISYRRMPLKYFLLALLPMALDGGTQLIGLRESDYITRLITGGLAGAASALFIMPSLLEVVDVCEKFLKKKTRAILKIFQS